MLATVVQLETDTGGGAAGALFGGAFFIVWLAFLAVYLVSAWKIWEKMGDPGWMGIVPILNYYRIYQRTRSDQAVLWTIGSVICCIGAFVAMFDLAKLFGKDIVWTLGLIFLPFIFLPMLAFGSATYVGPPAPSLS